MGNSLALLNTLFNICIALTIIFLALSVFLFIRFKIPDTLRELSGKTRADTIRQMQDNYATTGTLRQRDTGSLGSSELRRGSQDLNAQKNDSKGLTLTGRLPTGKQGREGSQMAFKIIKEQRIIHTQERIH